MKVVSELHKVSPVWAAHLSSNDRSTAYQIRDGHGYPGRSLGNAKNCVVGEAWLNTDLYWNLCDECSHYSRQFGSTVGLTPENQRGFAKHYLKEHAKEMEEARRDPEGWKERKKQEIKAMLKVESEAEVEACKRYREAYRSRVEHMQREEMRQRLSLPMASWPLAMEPVPIGEVIAEGHRRWVRRQLEDDPLAELREMYRTRDEPKTAVPEQFRGPLKVEMEEMPECE